jgi:hypothetical protein
MEKEHDNLEDLERDEPTAVTKRKRSKGHLVMLSLFLYNLTTLYQMQGYGRRDMKRQRHYECWTVMDYEVKGRGLFQCAIVEFVWKEKLWKSSSRTNLIPPKIWTGILELRWWKNSMKQRPFWEADIRSARQEILHSKAHFRFHEKRILVQTKQVNIYLHSVSHN